MGYKLLPLWALMLWCLVGCSGISSQTSTNATIPIVVLLEADQCQAQGIVATAKWVRDVDHLDPILSHKIKVEHPDAIPWDSDTQGVLVIHMGRQPTGGYRLSLSVPTLAVQRGVGVVKVTRHRPAIGDIVSQVISSPCLVLQFPFKSLKTVRVQDQEGHLLAEVAVR